MGTAFSLDEGRGGDLCCGMSPSKSHDSGVRFTRPSDVSPPPILVKFLEARAKGDLAASAAACTEDVVLRGPLGEFSGLDIVKDRVFTKPAQPSVKSIMALRHQPQMSSPSEIVFAREFEVQMGPDVKARVGLRQEFTIRHADSADPRISLVRYLKLDS